MSNPFFIPPPVFDTSIVLNRPKTVYQLCVEAGIVCRASGEWVNRTVEVRRGDNLSVRVQPGDWGAVLITSPVTGKVSRARLALYILAYGLHDLVAKESVRGTSLARIGPPLGRPKKQRPLSNCERQRRYRDRRGVRLSGRTT